MREHVPESTNEHKFSQTSLLDLNFSSLLLHTQTTPQGGRPKPSPSQRSAVPIDALAVASMATASARLTASRDILQHAVEDKENVAPAIPTTVTAARRKGLATLSSSSTSSTNVVVIDDEADVAVKKPTGSEAAAAALPRLLLFTEKAEEVFMLGEGLPEREARRKLAQAVMEDRGNPSPWWQLLQHVHRVFGESDSCVALDAAHIRKLYQKATRIIPDGPNRDKEDPALVNIWLGFAAAEGRVSESDAREAYAHMNRCGIGARSADFYVRYAEFEGRQGRSKEAINLLQTGITRGAAPLDVLLAKLDRLRAGGASPAATAAVAASPATPSPPSTALPSTASAAASVRGSTSTKKPTQQQQQQHQQPPTATPNPSTSAAAAAAAATTSTPPTPTPQALSSSSSSRSGERDRQQQQQEQQPIPPPTPTTTAAAAAEAPPSSSQKEGSKQQQQQQPRTAVKPKRLLPTGRLLGLGKAERVRFDTPAKSSSSSSSSDSEKEGEGGNEEGASSSSSSSSSAAAGTALPSSSPTTASSTAPPSSSSSSSTTSPGTQDYHLPPPHMDPTIPPPSLTVLQPIEEDEVTLGAGGGKGSDDTAGSHHHLPKQQQQQQPQTTGEICFRVQAVKTPLPSHRTTASLTPSSSNRHPLPPPPPSSSSGRRSSASVEKEGEEGGEGGRAEEDLTHTRDRGRAASSMRREGLVDFDFEGRSSLEEDNDGEYHHRQQQQQQQQQQPHSAAKPRSGSVTFSATKAPPPPHHQHHQHQQHHQATYAQPQPHPPPHHHQQHQPQQQHQQQFSFDTLLASRNFMTLNNTQYLRLDVLGRGGSSKVFRVLSDTGHIYALKRVRVPPKDGKALESFANEITLLARLKGHPCIIQLVDSSVDRATGLVLMLMELGEIDLSKLLAQQAAAEATDNDKKGKGRLSLNFVRFVWEQMLRAVHCVHEERIVHGDLKPANFVFVRGRLKLIDFGIAKAIGNDTTNIMRESQVGTVNYMSPEAILDTGNGREQPGMGGRRAPCMKIGRASDVWSLGCILYQLVYGKTPFADLNLIQKLHCIVDERYQIAFPDEEGAHVLHPDVRDTIQQCLRRDPTTRPPIAGGPTSLLQHPFLQATAEGAEAQVRQTIRATLAVLDKDPAVLQMEEGQRVGAVYERVQGMRRSGRREGEGQHR